MPNENTKKNQPSGMGRRRGPGSFGPVEKPKNTKKVLKRLVKYIGGFKGLFIAIMLVVIVMSATQIFSNVIVKNIVASFGSYSFDLSKWIVEPNVTSFTKNILIFAISMPSIFIVPESIS